MKLELELKLVLVLLQKLPLLRMQVLLHAHRLLRDGQLRRVLRDGGRGKVVTVEGV
jgi:hypothetical protein